MILWIMDLRKTKTICYFLLVLMLLVSQAFGQGRQNKSQAKNARASLGIAEQYIAIGDYEKAKNQLRHTLKLKEDFAVVYRLLGKVLSQLEDYDEAIKAYEASFNLDSNISRAAYFECGEAYFKLGEFESALFYFNEYRSKKDTKYANKSSESGLEVGYDELFKIRMENIQYVLRSQANGVENLPKNLGPSINTVNNEYLPAISNTGKRLVFTRDVKGRNENILTSSYNRTVKDWSTARKLDNRVNSNKNEGMAKFAADGKVFYFTSCNRPDSDGGCDIYSASLDMFGEVTTVNHINGLNSSFWESQPCVSCNGDVIYFSSIRPGGYGGSDIYSSELQEDGTWSEGKNLGPYINTAADEEAPYMATDGKSLYFTSDGHQGQGDGDLFVSRLENGNWTEAANLGYPINSQGKELGVFVHKDGKTIFFASARAEGNGGLDIYQYELPEEFRPKVMNNIYGFIVDDVTNEPIQVGLKIYREGEKYDFNSDERGQFFTCLKQNKAYTFHVEKEGYKPFMSAVFLGANEDNEPSAVEIRLIPENEKKVEEKPKEKPYTLIKKPKDIVKIVSFYFDTNSSTLNLQTQAKLDDLASIISENVDKWSIEVVGFADHTGSAEYNKKLSEKRATSVADYLNFSGIPIKNVRQEGKGAIASSTGMEMNKNRRVEVILTGQVMEEVKLYHVN